MTDDQRAHTREKSKLLETPDHPEAYAEFGQYLHAIVDYPSAIRSYSLGLRLNPKNDLLHCKIGLTHHNQGDHQAAIHHYQRATQLNPSNSEAHYYLGFILIQEARTPEAIQHLRHALKLNPDLHPAYYFLGIALERTGNNEEALDLLEQRFENTYPKLAPDVVFTLGELLSKRRRYHSATCHAQACMDALLEVLNKQQLHCFGDSHRSVFNNLDGLTCHNVGAGTAYNLITTNSTTGAGNKILKALRTLNPSQDAILLAFGEIDCMEHLGKNTVRSDTNPKQLIQVLADRFLGFAKQVTDRGFFVLIYGPAFSGVALNSHGQLRERNLMVKQFNMALEKACNQNSNLAFAALDHIAIDANLAPRLKLTNDGRHLDHFPSGSKVFQGIILSKFITRIQSDQQEHQTASWQKNDSYAYEHQCPFALIRLKSNAPSGSKNSRHLETGVTTTKSNWIITTGEHDQASLVIDLLDHLPINKINFCLRRESAETCADGRLEIFAFDKDGATRLAEQSFDAAREVVVDVGFSTAIARAICLRVQVQPTLAQPPAKLALILNNLTISGPSYSVQRHGRLIPHEP